MSDNAWGGLSDKVAGFGLPPLLTSRIYAPALDRPRSHYGRGLVTWYETTRASIDKPYSSRYDHAKKEDGVSNVLDEVIEANRKYAAGFGNKGQAGHAARAPVCDLDLHGCSAGSGEILRLSRRRCPCDPERGWQGQR